jgi:hypothetical protein
LKAPGQTSPDLYARLLGQAGRSIPWEGFPARLKELLTSKGHPTHCLNPEFHPAAYTTGSGRKSATSGGRSPDRRRFGTHGFRKRAFMEAWHMGIDPHKAAIAFGCNVQTMMRHYVALDETATSDEVLDALAGRLAVPQPGGGEERAGDGGDSGGREGCGN